jgi:hypothetical protein
MKTLARHAWTVSALGIALLLAGCETMHTARKQEPVKPAYDFTVVQSSSDRTLTPADLALLREAVAKFLAGQGLVRSGEYLVRVDFPPDQPGAAGEWVIVKLTNLPTPTYTLVAAYSASEPEYFDPYDLRYGSWAEPYYYDPFDFGRGIYCRPPPLHPYNRWDHDGGDHRPGDKDNHPTGTHARNDPRHDGNGWRDRDGRHDGVGKAVGDHRPGDKGDHPTGTHARNDPRRDGDGRHNGVGKSDGDHRPRATDGTARRGDTNRPRDYGSPSTVQVARERSGGGSYTPPPRSEGSSYSPPARSEPAAHQDSSSRSSSSNPSIQVTSSREKEN